MESNYDSSFPFPHLDSIENLIDKHATNPVSMIETIDSCLHRLKSINPEINSIVWTNTKHIEDSVNNLVELSKLLEHDDLKTRLPLFGVPVLVKELEGLIKGTPNSWGNKILKDSNNLDESTSESILRLQNAGAIIIGKTNNPELGLTVTTKSRAHGKCSNPLDLSRNSGGSSGGSAAGVASGITNVATGTDGGGSIRIPSSACGLYGFKPARNAVPLGPNIKESWAGLVTKGVISNNLDDLISLYNNICEQNFKIKDSDPLRKLSDLKIGVRLEGFASAYKINPSIQAAVNSVANFLESLGCQIEFSSPTSYDDEIIMERFLDIISFNTFLEVNYLNERIDSQITVDDCEKETQYFYNLGSHISKSKYVDSTRSIAVVSKEVKSWHEKFDLLITPTIGEVAPKHGYVESDPEHLPFVYSGLCFISNFTGAPALTIPINSGDDSRMPCGVQLVGTTQNTDLIFEVAGILKSDYSDILVTNF